ncbi:hypothetical protein AltI4_45030 (plasmid) [Alteromonas sp. I4]|nr:hypothetical protein AltI4_45030 [Alteromonas sp. I4]
MNLSLGNLQFVAKKLQVAAHNCATAKQVSAPMTAGESAVIEYLIEQKVPKSNREIVAATGIVQSWVSTVVKSLLNRGWIEIAPHKDKRVTAVRVREEVIEKANDILDVDGSIALQKLIPNAPAKQRKKIQDGLEALYLAILEENETE